MGILTRKITTYVKNIVDLSDHPNDDGLSAADLKAFFDGRTDAEIKTSINGLIDDLLATADGASGADQIGATPITGGVAVTTQGILEELNTLKAADSAVVHKTGTETVAGVKTFSSSPIVPTPTTNMQAPTKKYVDDAAAAKINTSAIVNDLTTGGTTVPLSAEQGKTLKTDKIETSAIVNGLAETNAGKVLDARQGKALADLISTNTLKINEKTSYGVLGAGLVVSQQTVPDMTVKCSGDTYYMPNGDRFVISAVASIAVTAADATNPRIDIVYVSSLGAITYLAGTAATTPSAPSVPAGGQKIAEINVAAGATSILTANIVDKRKFLWTEAWQTPTFINGATGTFRYRKNILNRLEFKGRITTAIANSAPFILPVNYRPPSTIDYLPIINTANTATSMYISSGGLFHIYGPAETYIFDAVSVSLE